MRTKVLGISVFLVLALSVLSACGSAKVERPPDEVTVQLKSVHQARFAGFYVAEKKGFFSEEKINVTLNEGGNDIPSNAVISDLVRGRTDFAVVGGDVLLESRSMGEPVVAVAVIFQRNPYVYVTLEDSGIERPQDLVGKKVMVPDEGRIQHEALIKKVGIAENSIVLVPYERGTEPLIEGRTDAYMTYMIGTALAFEEKGCKTKFIWVENYGIRIYGDTIVTTDRTVAEKPDMVGRFLRAALRGWQYAIENPEEAVGATLKYDTMLSKFRQLRMMQVQTPLIHTGKVKIGWMDENIWMGMRDILFGKDTIDIDRAFTMRFLDEIYDKVR